MFAANFYLLPLLLITTACIISGHVSNDIVSIEDDIVKPPNDHRQYRALTLANGMKILLISDNEMSEASVALDVMNAGYMNSPKNTPYLADVFARTILLASWPQITEKSMNRISKFFEVSEGLVTSTTNADHAMFDFRSIQDPLADVLKRFSDQLVSPQISMDLLERGIWELSYDEHFNHRFNGWRWKMFLRSMANRSHAYYAPNLISEVPKNLSSESINKLALLKDMFQFYNRQYSANLMSLVIVAKQHIEEIMQTVVALFSRVPNKNLPVPVWRNHPYGSEQTGYLFHIEANRYNSRDKLMILFNVPVRASYYFASNPWSYVIHALTGKGEKSLTVVLKDKGLATKVTATIEKLAEGFGFFTISCHLIQKREQNVEQVLQVIMEYINYLKSMEPQEWIYRELQKKSALKFEQMSPDSTHIDEVLLLRLRTVPTKYCIDERYALREFQPQSIKNILSHLTPDNMNAYVWTKTVSSKPRKIGKFFDKKYTMKKMSPAFLYKLRSKNHSTNFSLPAPNPYLPEHQSNNVKSRIPAAKIPLPRVIWESEAHRIWHSKDTVFNSLEVFIGFKLMNSVKHASLTNYATSILYSDLVQRVISTKFEKERIARMHVVFSSLYMGNALYFEGRRDNIYQFVIRAMETLTSPTTFNEKLFTWCKAKRNKWIRRNRYDSPMMKADLYAKFWKSPLKWTKAEIEDSLKEITYDQFNRFQQKFFDRLYTEMFAYGNITAQDTANLYIDVLNIIKKRFSAEPLPLIDIKRPRMALLPAGTHYVFRTTANIKEFGESAIRILYQSDPNESLEKMKIRKATFCMIKEIDRQSERKLKSSSEEEENDALILHMNIYGSTVDFSVEGISNTLKRFDLAVEDYIKMLENKLMEMNATELEKIKTRCRRSFVALIDPLVFESMEDAAYYFWTQILRGEYSFNKTQLAYQDVSKNDIATYFKEILSTDSPKRRKIAIFVCGPSSDKCKENINDRNVPYIITDFKGFRNTVYWYATSDEPLERDTRPMTDSPEETDDL